MATIVRRDNKSGVTYRIQVKTKDKGSGKITVHSTTWKPAPGMTEKQIQREVLVFADKYEQQMQAAALAAKGEAFMPADTTLAEYADRWLERRKGEVSDTYYVNLQFAIDEIKECIGGYTLRELNPAIIQNFYDGLDRKEHTVVTVTGKPDAIRKRMKATGKRLKHFRYDLKFNSNALSTAMRGEAVSMGFAKALAKELDTTVEKLFKIKEERKRYAYETMSHRKRTLRVILATAKRQRLVPDNYASADYITFPKKPPREIDYMNDEDAKRFYAAAEKFPKINIKTAVELLLLTGIRRGELCGLEWDDIDFENECITIRRSVVVVKGKGPVTKDPKTTSSNRVIGVSDHLLKILREYKAWYDQYREDMGDRWVESKRLFVQTNGKPVHPSTVGSWVERVCKAANLPTRGVHSLRHTNITMQIMAGVPIVTVSGRAGHARTSTTTDIYCHFLKSSDKMAAKVLESIFEPAEE